MHAPVVRTLLVGALALTLAACAGSPAASGSPATEPSIDAPSPSVEPSVAPSASSSAAAGATLDVTATDFAFDLPDSIQAGPTALTLRNEGAEEHQAQIARLNADVTLEQLTTELQNPDPSGALGLVTLVGGPTGVLPGEEATTGLDLEAGTHVFLCFVGGEDGVPHIAKGMIAPLEVTEPAADGDLPAGDAQLTLQDFAFVGLDTLAAGPHTISVTNAGPQPHEATIVKLADGVTVDMLRGMFSSTEEPPSGPPPFISAGGIAGFAPGTTATVDVDLEPGDYAWVCFIPDPATGKAHAELGMIGALTVQ